VTGFWGDVRCLYGGGACVSVLGVGPRHALSRQQSRKKCIRRPAAPGAADKPTTGSTTATNCRGSYTSAGDWHQPAAPCGFMPVECHPCLQQQGVLGAGGLWVVGNPADCVGFPSPAPSDFNHGAHCLAHKMEHSLPDCLHGVSSFSCTD